MKRGYRYNSAIATYSYYNNALNQANFGMLGAIDNGLQWVGNKVVNPIAESMINKGTVMRQQAGALRGQADEAANQLMNSKGAKGWVNTADDGSYAFNQDKLTNMTQRAGKNENRVNALNQNAQQFQGQIGKVNELSNQATQTGNQALGLTTRGTGLQNNKNLKRGIGIAGAGAVGLGGLAAGNAVMGGNNRPQY